MMQQRAHRFRHFTQLTAMLLTRVVDAVHFRRRCLRVGSKNSCGIALVVFQEPTEPFTTVYRASMLRVLADHRTKPYVALP